MHLQKRQILCAPLWTLCAVSCGSFTPLPPHWNTTTTWNTTHEAVGNLCLIVAPLAPVIFFWDGAPTCCVAGALSGRLPLYVTRMMERKWCFTTKYVSEVAVFFRKNGSRNQKIVIWFFDGYPIFCYIFKDIKSYPSSKREGGAFGRE